MAVLNQSTKPTSAEKFARQLVACFSNSRAGQLVLDALADDDVTKVYLSPDGKLWKTRTRRGRYGDRAGTGALLPGSLLLAMH